MPQRALAATLSRPNPLAPIAGCVRHNFHAVKDVFDLLAASVLLVLTLPILAILAVLVKFTSRGPVLFRQVRVGEDGRLFDMYKLRSMYHDCERETGPVWAAAADPRITPIGRLLRRTHLDELPQLLNVIRGEMSLVGPRPERPPFVEELCRRLPAYRRRLRVKPGITGLAQVRHRYDATFEDVRKKLAYDLLYIRKMCWMVDFGILLRTFTRLTGRGAR